MPNQDQLVAKLKKLGYDNIKIKNKTIGVIVDEKNRSKHLENIAKKLKMKLTYDTTPCTQSSIGKVIVGKYKIVVKPKFRNGICPNWFSNEKFFFNELSKYLKKAKKLNISFRSGRKFIRAANVTKIQIVNNDNLDKTARADIILHGDKKIAISVKQENSEYWCKLESYFKEEAREIVERLIKEKKVVLKDMTGYYRLDPEVAIRVDSHKKKFAAFGTDNAKVVKNTFTKQDFIFDGEKNLVIQVKGIFTKTSQLKNADDVFFLIRNMRGRKVKDFYPGLSISAVSKGRVENKGKRNILLIK